MEHMLQRWSTYRTLEQFFDSPRKAFLVRELSRSTKLAQTAVRLHLKALLTDGLIVREKAGPYPAFKASRESPLFKLLKAQNTVLRLLRSGAVERIEKAAYPTCIVLFGSASRGEDIETSDIDLFVQAKRKPVELTPFERALKRKINTLFEPDLRTVSSELRNNLANGAVLSGYLKVL